MYRWPDYDAVELHRARSSRVLEVLRDNDLDALLLTAPDHIRYATDVRTQLTNETEWFAALVLGDGSSQVLLPYIDEVVDTPFPDLPWVTRAYPVASWSAASANPRTWVTAAAMMMRNTGGRTRVGVDAIDTGLLSALRSEAEGVNFIPVSTQLHRARREKHPLELQLLEAASRVNAGAMLAALEAARVGGTDHDVLAEAMAYQQKAGVEYVTHSVCNLRNGSGAWFAGGRTFKEGDSFFFDIGCYGAGGDASDAGRTGFVGEPRSAYRKAYEHLLIAYELVKERALPGTRASELLAVCNKYLENQGLRRTPNAIGHGVGLRIAELPTLFSEGLMDEDATLRVGDVIAIEPETAVEDDHGVAVLKIEDNFVMEEAGLRQLTNAPEAYEFI